MRPLVSVPLKYGAIAGAIGLALVITLYYMDRHPFLVPVHFDFRIALFGVFLYFTLKELRDYCFDGILYFWQGLIACFIFVSTFGLVAGAAIFLFATVVPDFLSSYIALSIEQLKSLPKEVIDQIGKNVYDRNLLQLPSTNSLDLAMLYFWQSLMIGLFISIILSVLLRKQPKL